MISLERINCQEDQILPLNANHRFKTPNSGFRTLDILTTSGKLWAKPWKQTNHGIQTTINKKTTSPSYPLPPKKEFLFSAPKQNHSQKKHNTFSFGPFCKAHYNTPSLSAPLRSLRGCSARAGCSWVVAFDGGLELHPFLRQDLLLAEGVHLKRREAKRLGETPGGWE